MPHNPFSMTFIFLESAPLPCQPVLSCRHKGPHQLCAIINRIVYLIYLMCTSHEENKCLLSPTKQSDDQKKHGAQGELIRWTNTFLLDIFGGFIILHQVTAEEKKQSLVFIPVTSAGTDRAQGKNQSQDDHIFPINWSNNMIRQFFLCPPPNLQLTVSKIPIS